jgi:cytochrome P450 family 138
MLERVELEPTAAPDEGWKFRGVAWTPSLGGKAVIRRRQPAASAARPVYAAAGTAR